MPILRSARTILVLIEVDDAEFLHELIQTEGWKQNIYDYQFTSVEQTIELIQNRFITNVEQHGYGYFIVNNEEKQKIGFKKGSSSKPRYWLCLYTRVLPTRVCS